jgi:predicted nucleotidyltransferase
VYGSIAKGSATATSDIDFMLIGDTISYRAILSALAPAERALGRKINPTPYTKDEFIRRHQEQQHFLMRVLEQSKIFIIGGEDQLRRISKPNGDREAQA